MFIGANIYVDWCQFGSLSILRDIKILCFTFILINANIYMD